MAVRQLLVLKQSLGAETEHKHKWVGAEGGKQGEMVDREKRQKTEWDSNECCMMHLAVVAPWEAFLTLFHTIKTSSIRQVHVASTQHIESDIFSRVFRPFSLCEMVDMNLDTHPFDLPVLLSKACVHAGINKETFGLF